MKKTTFALILLSLVLCFNSTNTAHAQKMAEEMDKSYGEINARINELKQNGYLTEKASNNKLYTQLNNLMKEIIPYTKGASSEDREKPYYEDRLVSIIKRVPPEMYQYIGPYMHSVPYT